MRPAEDKWWKYPVKSGIKCPFIIVLTCEADTELSERPLRGDEAIHYAHNTWGGEEHEQRPPERVMNECHDTAKIVMKKNKIKWDELSTN